MASETAIDATLPPGAVFATRYEVVSLLGRGAMGAVYRVVDRELGETVALKVLTAAATEEALARFRREVRLARRITSRQVARIHDIGEERGLLYLTMECVAGESLESFAARAGGPLAPSSAARFGIQIADGLAAAHEVGVVHRDLKPANVLLEHARDPAHEPRVVLTDFGIARSAEDVALTQVGATFIGTPAYMAPEQVLGEPVDARTDVYALGLVLYELLTFALPFETPGIGVMALALARCRALPADPRTHVAIPDELAALVMHCVATSPAERPRNVVEVRERLRAWVARASGVRRAEVPEGTGAMPGGAGAMSGGAGAMPGGAGAMPGGAGAMPGGAGAGATLGEGGGALSFAAAMPAEESDVDVSFETNALRPRSSAGRPWLSSAPYAPIPERTRLIAIAPFRFRGPADDGYVAEALREELIDVLSTTKGLRVLASFACAHLGADADPREVGRELGADEIVDVTLQLMRRGDGSGDVRVTARLVDVKSGVQSWQERFDSRYEDVFALQESMSRRIAEALRVEVDSVPVGSEIPHEAVDLYLRARKRLASHNLLDSCHALGLLEQALALAPKFPTAQAAYAIACVRGWWTDPVSTTRDWRSLAGLAVARALDGAPHAAETHLASAMYSTNCGDLPAAAVALGRALELAPTFAQAHAYLGQLQCEAGRVDEGTRRLRLALELAPNSWQPRLTLARVAALRSSWDESEHHLVEVTRIHGEHHLAAFGLRLRLAAWSGDHQQLEALTHVAISGEHPLGHLFGAYAQYVLGHAEGFERMRDLTAHQNNPRMASIIEQLCAEAFGARGRHELALDAMGRGAEQALVDIDWVERCPLLTGARALPGYAAVAAKVRARSRELWRA